MKRTKKIIIFTLVMLLGFYSIGKIIVYNHQSQPSSVENYVTNNKYITKDKALVSAHRSGGETAPEETMMAFENCVNSKDFKTDIFEFDLHLTKDNVLVLLHDDTLDRTSDSRYIFGEEDVKPQDKTYEELRKLNMGANFENEKKEKPYADLHNENVPDELKILKVEDVLDYLMANGDFDYIIEIKDSGKVGFKGVDLLYEILKERNLIDKVIFGTFNGEVSQYVDDNYKDLNRSAGIKEVIDFYYKSITGKEKLNVKYTVLQIPYKLAGFNLGTAKIINYAHKNNIAVQYWTINDEKDIKYLNSIGADCIMSDDPYLAYKIINEGK